MRTRIKSYMLIKVLLPFISITTTMEGCLSEFITTWAGIVIAISYPLLLDFFITKRTEFTTTPMPPMGSFGCG